jgi:hypothetical protein
MPPPRRRLEVCRSPSRFDETGSRDQSFRRGRAVAGDKGEPEWDRCRPAKHQLPEAMVRTRPSRAWKNVADCRPTPYTPRRVEKANSGYNHYKSGRRKALCQNQRATNRFSSGHWAMWSGYPASHSFLSCSCGGRISTFRWPHEWKDLKRAETRSIPSEAMIYFCSVHCSRECGRTGGFCTIHRLAPGDLDFTIIPSERTPVFCDQSPRMGDADLRMTA